MIAARLRHDASSVDVGGGAALSESTLNKSNVQVEGVPSHSGFPNRAEQDQQHFTTEDTEDTEEPRKQPLLFAFLCVLCVLCGSLLFHEVLRRWRKPLALTNRMGREMVANSYRSRESVSECTERALL